MSRIFVSGSNLQWVNPKNSITQSICGVVPDPVPAGFSGQPAGRIWVAQDGRDTGLYYSDGGGLTRFIAGMDKGTDNTLPSGRVYLNEGCGTPTEIWWTTPSGSDILIRAARAEGVRESYLQNLRWDWRYRGYLGVGSTSSSFELSYVGDNGGTNLSNAVTVTDVTVKVYSSLANCGAGTPVVETLGPLSVTLGANASASQVSLVNVTNTTYTNGYVFRLETGSSFLVDGSPYGPYDGYFCNGNPPYTSVVDYARVRFFADQQNEPGVCYTIRSSGGSPPPSTCGITCYTGPAGPGNVAECLANAADCNTCSGQQGVNGGQGVCYNPSSPPPPPPPAACGNPCTPKDLSQCTAGCPVCCNNVCSSRCPE